MISLIRNSLLGYSPANTPHLTPAFELDSAISEFSGMLESIGLPTRISTAHDLDVLMEALEKVVRNLHLWQYYVLDPVLEKEAVKSVISSGKVEPWKGPDVKGREAAELATIFRSTENFKGLGQFTKRFGVHADGGIAAGFVKAAVGESEASQPEKLATLWQAVVDVMNVNLYKEWEDDTKTAIEHVRNRAKYIRLDENGPKLGPISKE